MQRLEQQRWFALSKVEVSWNRILELCKEFGETTLFLPKKDEGYQQIDICLAHNKYGWALHTRYSKSGIETEQGKKFAGPYWYYQATLDRLGLMNDALSQAMIEFLLQQQRKKFPDHLMYGLRFKLGERFKLVLNGRAYWYVATGKFGYAPFPEELSWPGESNEKEFLLNDSTAAMEAVLRMKEDRKYRKR